MTHPPTNALQLRLHAFLPASRANGPGNRAVLWVQGCSLGCPECFNPATHLFAGGEECSVADLVARVLALGSTIQGLTLSGGEPLQQSAAVATLLAEIRHRSALSVVLFTGYSWSELPAVRGAAAVLAQVDVAICGRYVAAERLAEGLRGSANKTIHHLSPRYTPADIAAVPEAEIWLGPGGEIHASGIRPLRFD